MTETKTVMEVSGSEVHFDDGSSISLPAEVAKKFQIGDVTQVRLVLRRADRD